MAAQSHPSLQLRDLKTRPNPVVAELLSDPRLHFTYNGRGAIYQLLMSGAAGSGGTVLVPAFHCPTVVDPVIAAGFDIQYYGIGKDLRISIEDVKARLQPDVVAMIVINYFGFRDLPSEIESACKQAGILLIEDFAHSFLLADPVQLAGQTASASIYSFKKLVPSMVGGGFLVDRTLISDLPASSPPPARNSIVNIKRLLEQTIDNLDDQSRVKRSLLALEQFRVSRKRRRLGAQAPDHNARILQFDYPFDQRLASGLMPWYAKRILFAADMGDIATVRRRNFSFLLDRLRDQRNLLPVFNSLPERVCPWAFPLSVGNRSGIDILFREAGIPVFTFGETLHWTLNEQADSDPNLVRIARRLSDTMLCLPVHQQLSTNDLERYCSQIEAVMRDEDVPDRAAESR